VKAAFWMNQGLFKPLVMFFGLINSLEMFQMMMNNIFQELIDKGVMVNYMADILIFWLDQGATPCHHSMGPRHHLQALALPQS